MAVLERWALWRGGCCEEVAIVERRALWRGGHCEEVAVSGGSTKHLQTRVVIGRCL